MSNAPTAVANAFVLACTLSGLLFAYAAWQDRFATAWTAVGAHGRRVSWALLTAHLLAGIHFLGEPRDVYALATEGPSAQNLVQAAVLAAAAVWVFHLLARGHVPWPALRSGPALWVSLLTVVYLASTVWSAWPEVTLYRATELVVFWVLVVHLLAQPWWEESLRALLWLGLGVAWLAQLVHLDLGAAPGTLFGFAYDNISTLVAAALLLVEMHHWTRRPSVAGAALLGTAGLSVLAFGSLATSVALIVAGVAFVTVRGRTEGRSRELLFVGALVTVAALGSLLLHPQGGAGDDLVAEIAELSGKEVSHIESMTGRLPLWKAVVGATAGEPLGLGFAGAERALALGFVQVAEVGWTASHAHNGYLSAWLGAGWPGVLLVLMIFLGVWQRSRGLPVERRALVAALLVLLAINNLTATAVGGELGLPWMVMMALVCVSSAETPVTPLPQADSGRRGAHG